MKKKKSLPKPRTTFADYGCPNPVTRVVRAKKGKGSYQRTNKGSARASYFRDGVA